MSQDNSFAANTAKMIQQQEKNLNFLANKGDAVEKDCPNCDSKEAKVVFTAGGMMHTECPGCGMQDDVERPLAKTVAYP